MKKSRDSNYYKKNCLSMLRDSAFSTVAFLFHLQLYYLGCDLKLKLFNEFNGTMALFIGFYALLCCCVGFVCFVIYDVKKKKENKLDEKK